MKFAITICGTEKYSYAMTAQARRVSAAVRHIEKGTVILVGDQSKRLRLIAKLYQDLLPAWDVRLIGPEKIDDSHQNYKHNAQLLIGQLRTAAFSAARSVGADQCWSLDSDVLPPSNALRVSQQVLDFDDGFYGVAACPYPSQGGGGFLCGRGTHYNPILPDVYEEERILPEELKTKLIEARAKMGEAQKKNDQKEVDEVAKELRKLDEQVRECPGLGNVWILNGKNYKRRGWLENAYPGVGRGAIVPSEWCGFGCTLLGAKALDDAHFDGYTGEGTEDLYVCFHRWYLSGIRIAAVTHCLADHVIRNPGKPGHFVQMQAFHEHEGECMNHPRYRPRPFYAFDIGEKFNSENDGKFLPPPK